MIKSKETLYEYVKRINPDKTIDIWDSENSFVPWFIPQALWEQPVEEAEKYFIQIRLIKE